MSWGLDMAARELAADMKKAGIEIDLKACVLFPTRTTALKMERFKDSSYYRKVIKEAIKNVNDQKAAAIQAKQTSLL